MRLLCRYAGGLACLVTALALVACGGGPGSQPEPKQIGNIAFQQGEKVRTISLSDKFNGADLTYSATTSNRSVATVTVDNDADTLTVTVVGPGTATITVTAKNSRGEAKQTFTVTVPKPPAPDPEPEPEPEPVVPPPADEEGAPAVKDDAPEDVELDDGETEEVDLSDVFEGDNLEFSETSDDDTVATANISGTTLTITAIGPGTATITIVATKAAESEEHEIEVTVSSAPATTPPTTTTPEPQPSTTCKVPPYNITITISRDGNMRCTLPTKHHLRESALANGKVSVHRPAAGDKTNNIWTITAIEKGEHIVYVNSDDSGEEIGRIKIVVPNTGPNRERNRNPAKVAELFASNTPGSTTTAPLAAVTFFTDVDVVDRCSADSDDPLCANVTAGNGAFRYKISDKPEGLLIDTKDGFAVVGRPPTDDITMEAVVLTPLKDNFHIELYAYDRDNERSDNPVKFTFGAIAPHSGTYTVGQSANGKVATIGGVEKALRIGNRLDVPHEIVIGGDGAFTIASEKIKELSPDSGNVRVNPSVNLPDGFPTGGADSLCNADFSIPKWTTTTPLGEDCYSIKSSAPSILKITAFDVETKTITFRLPSKNRSVSATGKPEITITYHVRALSSGIAPNTEPFPTTGTRNESAAMKIPVDIYRCTETSDCLLMAE